jgi:drug/metabolite transporter (DMT)-like permease
MATRLDKVGEAAVLRETSIIFAAFIGWFIMGEKVGPRRLILMSVVALGAVIVEMGGKEYTDGRKDDQSDTQTSA